MKRGRIVLLLMAVFMVMPFVSADIIIDELHSLYNVGDLIVANVSISSSKANSGFFSASLICGVNEIEVYKSMEFLSAGEEKKISIKAVIGNEILGSLDKECYIRALYGNGEARSRPFQISRNLNVEVLLDPPVIKPGERVNVSGIVVKDNREMLEGYVEISVEGIEINVPTLQTESEVISNENVGNESISNETIEEDVEETDDVVEETNFSSGVFSREVHEGSFSGYFLIQGDTPPGTFRFRARAFDLDDDGNLLNSGESFGTIRVEQVINDVDIAYNANSFVPGTEFAYKPIVYDQAGNEGQGDVGIEIRKPDKSLYFGKLVKAGETQAIMLDSNFTPGYWEISAKFESLEKKKMFYVEELQKILYELKDGILTIRNVGNVPYDKQVEISIGGKSEIRRIDLGIDGNTQFKLGAPDGEYEVSIKEGNMSQSLGRTFLTGRAVGIEEIGNILFEDIWIWVWTLLIAILLVISFILIRKVIKRKFVGKIPKTVSATGVVQQYTPQFKKDVPITGMSNVIENGTKEDAGVISLKIKNLQALQNGGGLENIEKALLKAKDVRAKIYVDNNYRIAIFTPSITKSNDNDLLAVSVAYEIAKVINDYNKTASQKIEFGIGVHYGRLAVDTSDGKAKFVSLDNTISVSKRVADYSNGNVLLSDSMHKNTLGKVKVEKLEAGYWELKRIADRTYYEEFIQKFLTRQRNMGK